MSASSPASTPRAIRSLSRVTTATGFGKRRYRAAGSTPTSCRRADPHVIAGGNGAAGDHLGVDAAVGVTETAHQRRRDIEVANGGFRIDIDGGGGRDTPDGLRPGLG